MAQIKKDEATLRRFLERQAVDNYGALYQPAVRATPKEAPSSSRCWILRPEKLQGRGFHLLSNGELAAGLLALYNPAVFDIHEQRMLSTGPRMHPLAGHPYAAGLRLPAFRGTIVVADELGHLKMHPKLYLATGEGMWVPFPYTSDLLLFLLDKHSPYCINWSVKDKRKHFTRRSAGLSSRPSRNETDPVVVARQKIEERYYEDAGIRTVQMAAEDIHPEVVNNLRDCFGFHARTVQLAAGSRTKLIDFFAKHVGGSVPCIELLIQAERDFGFPRLDIKTVLYTGIWRRELDVDLYEPILIDRPLRIASRDVLADYTPWFRR